MVKVRSYIRNKSIRGGVKINNFIALIIFLILIFLAFFYYKTVYMKESFVVSTEPTQIQITNANNAIFNLLYDQTNMKTQIYNKITFSDYWTTYFAPYHSINCDYSNSEFIDYIFKHIGYKLTKNSDNVANFPKISNYSYQLFLDNNPQIKKNLTQKYNGKIFAITPDIYYNVFVPIFIAYYSNLDWDLITFQKSNNKPKDFLNSLCNLKTNNLKTNKKYIN